LKADGKNDETTGKYLRTKKRSLTQKKDLKVNILMQSTLFSTTENN